MQELPGTLLLGSQGAGYFRASKIFMAFKELFSSSHSSVYICLGFSVFQSYLDQGGQVQDWLPRPLFLCACGLGVAPCDFQRAVTFSFQWWQQSPWVVPQEPLALRHRESRQPSSFLPHKSSHFPPQISLGCTNLWSVVTSRRKLISFLKAVGSYSQSQGHCNQRQAIEVGAVEFWLVSKEVSCHVVAEVRNGRVKSSAVCNAWRTDRILFTILGSAHNTELVHREQIQNNTIILGNF